MPQSASCDPWPPRESPERKRRLHSTLPHTIASGRNHGSFAYSSRN